MLRSLIFPTTSPNSNSFQKQFEYSGDSLFTTKDFNRELLNLIYYFFFLNFRTRIQRNLFKRTPLSMSWRALLTKYFSSKPPPGVLSCELYYAACGIEFTCTAATSDGTCLICSQCRLVVCSEVKVLNWVDEILALDTREVLLGGWSNYIRCVLHLNEFRNT